MDGEEGVAIVGIACRFPGADDIDEFWKILVNGECHIGEVPLQRWDVENTGVKDADETWKACARHAALISEFDKWDNKFFGISDTEAGWMNPQHCLTLEVTQSALENAGFTKNSVKGTKTAVYIGQMNDDMQTGLSNAKDEFNSFLATGFASNMTSNRISFHYDFRGPSITIDTACSSALVAIDLGCKSIISGDCEMAVCGGVNIILTPLKFIALNKAGMISRSGRSHAFCEDADGYVRGEGCGIVILKKYKQAKLDGNTIYGVIATHCNQDGNTTTPITSPSSEQQQALFNSIYTKFDVDPSAVQYIEAHGTGTQVGDQVEIHALSTFFRPYLQKNNIISIGSVKTNIGHLESSAGVASLIKVLLMMYHGKIVPSLHYTDTNSNKNINFDNSPLKVATHVKDWKSDSKGYRYACVNSFGFGGTNAHAIIINIEDSKNVSQRVEEVEYLPLFLSGTSPSALTKSVEYLKMKLDTTVDSIRNISFTSVMKRDHFKYRMAFVASSLDELKIDIETKQPRLYSQTEVINSEEPNVVFLFCGVGTLWPGTCQQMLKKFKVFRETFLQVQKEIHRYARISLINGVKQEAEHMVNNLLTGPLTIFACQVSLFHLWQSLGLHPNVIVGQSVGEVAASYAAGIFDLENAVKIIYYRSLLTSKQTGGGMMVVGKYDVKQIERECQTPTFNGKLCIAVYISKESCVVSGDRSAIIKLTTKLRKHAPSVLLTDLKVDCAYHSNHMDKASEKLEQHLVHLHGGNPSIKTISSVFGQEITGTDMTSPSYWAKNLRQHVQMEKAVLESLVAGKTNIILEIGPSPVMKAHLRNITKAKAFDIPSLNKPKELKAFTNAVGELFEHGINLKWKFCFRDNEKLASLPRYQFNRSGNLLTSAALREGIQSVTKYCNPHPFLKVKPFSTDMLVEISPSSTPYVYEHTFQQHGRSFSIVPGAIHAEIALQAAFTQFPVHNAHIVISLQFIKPLTVSKHQTLRLETKIQKSKTIAITKKEEIVCKAEVNIRDKVFRQKINIDEVKHRLPKSMNDEAFYGILKKLGFTYGESLTVIKNCRFSKTECLAEMHVSQNTIGLSSVFRVHPVVIDGALQTMAVFHQEKTKSRGNDNEERLIPVCIQSLLLHNKIVNKIFVFGKLTKSDHLGSSMDLFLTDIDGQIIIEIIGYEVRNVAPEITHDLLDEYRYMYSLKWLPINTSKTTKCISGKTLSISFNESSRNALNNVQQENNYILLIDAPEDCYKTSFFDKTLHSLPNKFGKIQDISQIIFFPGFANINYLYGDALYLQVKQSCYALMNLIKHLLQLKLNIPLYILTQKTQPCALQAVQDGAINVNGSELWGMGRCLVREGSYTALRLVDFEENEDLCLLAYIMDDSDNELINQSKEFKLEKNQIFINQVERNSADRVSNRINTFINDENLLLRSKYPNPVSEPYFIHQKSGEICKPSAEYVRLKILTASTREDWIPSTVTQVMGEHYPWLWHSEDGHQIIVSEITGYITNQIYDRAVSTDILYVSCFPCHCKTFVSIPKTCLVEKSLLPNYQPGILLEIIMCFELLNISCKNASVLIIIDKKLDLDIKLFEYITGSLNRNIVQIDEIRSSTVPDNLNILALTKQFGKIKDAISRLRNSKVNIMSFACLMSNSTEMMLRTEFHDISIKLLNINELLSKGNLSKSLESIKSWLKKETVHQNLSLIQKHRNSCKTYIFSDNNELGLGDKVFKAYHLPVVCLRDKLFSMNATYIIVGGLTGLGWKIVEEIGRMGGGVLAILSRLSPDDSQRRDMKTVAVSNKCIVEHFEADICDMQSTRNAFQKVKSKFPNYPIKGIFNGAAVVDDAIILDMTEEKMEKVLRPKVLGTWNLHLLSADLNLDYFVVHSSVTSVLGNSGQTNYGAGNAFKDAVAWHRRSLGLPGQTINWGPLDLGIVKSVRHLQASLESQGLLLVKEAEIVKCFLTALCDNSTQVICGNFDWKTIVGHSPDMRHAASRFQLILKDLNLKDIFSKSADTSFDYHELVNLPADEKKLRIVELVTNISADIFAVEKVTIKPNTSLLNLGIDSLKASAFINRVNDYVNCNISIVAILDDSATIEIVSSLIIDKLWSMK